jgi:hypothetical protein
MPRVDVHNIDVICIGPVLKAGKEGDAAKRIIFHKWEDHRSSHHFPTTSSWQNGA